MTQRVSRAERLRRQRSGDRGFVYRRRLGDLAPILKALYPMGPADWPSAATVHVTVMVGRLGGRRPVAMALRTRLSWNEAEARRRAVSKLRLSPGEAWRLVKVGPVRPDGIPGVKRVLYRDAPLFGMVKREVVDG